MRDWPPMASRVAFDDNCEDGAMRYVLEGSGTVSCGGDTIPIAVGMLVTVGSDATAEFAPRALLRWTPDDECDELVLLTPEYKGVPLLPVAGAFFAMCAALIVATTGGGS